MMLSDVCLSDICLSPKSGTGRPKLVQQ